MTVFANRSTWLVLAGVVSLTAIVSTQAPQAPDRVDVLINFRGPVSADDRTLVASAGGRIRFSYTIVSAIAANLPAAAATALANHPRVSFIEPDAELFANDIDAELDNTWGVNTIGSGTAHSSVPPVLGAGINVAVIDSGIDYIDSAGIGMIAANLKTLRERGGDMKLANLSTRGQRIFGMAKLHLMFETFDTEADAVRSFAMKVR